MTDARAVMDGAWDSIFKTLAGNCSEHASQAALIEWRDAMLRLGHLPELRLLFAVHNGEEREPAVAAKLKDEGVVPGVPDLLLLVARRGFHGLAIEMKTTRGRVSDAQQEFIERLGAEGYSTWVARTWPDAARRVLWYLGAEPQLAPER